MLGFVAVMNVINFIDGVDGLAAGVCVISAATLSIIALSLDRPGAGGAGRAHRRRVARLPAPRIPAGLELHGRHRLEPARLPARHHRRPGRPEDERRRRAVLPADRAGGADPGYRLRGREAASSTGVPSTRPTAGTSTTGWRTSGSRSAGRSSTCTAGRSCWPGLALALRFVPYSDNHGHFDAAWTAVMVVCGLAALAASVYLLVALEILKLRVFRFRELVGERVPGRRPPSRSMPASREELETGSFPRSIPRPASSRRSSATRASTKPCKARIRRLPSRRVCGRASRLGRRAGFGYIRPRRLAPACSRACAAICSFGVNPDVPSRRLQPR